MARIFFLFAFSLSVSAASFVHTVLPSFTTNYVELHTVTSNYLVFRGTEAPSHPFGFQDGVVYVCARGANGKVQKIKRTNEIGEFGFDLALAEDTLIIKDGYNTYFYRQQNGQWNTDGEILGVPNEFAWNGSVNVRGNFLAIGRKIFQWQSRQYVQTLPAPPGLETISPNTVFSDDDIVLVGPTNLWHYDNRGDYFTNAIQIASPPSDVAYTAFGNALVSRYGFLFVGAPYDDERGENSGAVHVYLKSADGSTHFYQQKLMPAMAMAEDRFGSAIAMDVRNFKLYVAAPNRNETRQHSGAIFIYGLSDTRLSRYWVEREKIILSDALDNANLGLTLNVHNDTLYAMAAKEIHAFSPGVRLEMFGNGNNINVEFDPAGPHGSIEFSDDLMTWKASTEMFPSYPTAPARYYRFKQPSPF